MNKGVLAGLGPGDGPDAISSDAGQNAVLTAGGRKEVVWSTTTVQAVAVTDVSNYRSVSIHYVSSGTSGVLTPQISNDGINWVGIACSSMADIGTTAWALIPGAVGAIYIGSLGCRYFRLNVTGISAGTNSGVLEFFANPVTPPRVAVNATSPAGGILQVNPASTIAPADGQANSANLYAQASGYAFNGATHDRLRTPNTFKTATATASGDTAVWTPTAGKKFRLMRYQIQITGDAALAVAADLDIILRDSATGLAFAYSMYVPAASVAALGSDNSGWVDLGNGYLSTTINNVLNVNLSAALTSGKVRVVTAGTEE